jgi:hypothetical protein
MGSRDQMRNLEVFKVGADAVNEFEYQKNQGELTEQREHHLERPDSPSGPGTEAERIEQVIADAHAKVEERKRKAARGAHKKAAAKNSPGKRSTKKSPAKKSSVKKSAKRSVAKSTAKKFAAKRTPARKTASKKKSTARKSPARKAGAKRS